MELSNEQRSVEWRKERLGRVTASRFVDVLGSAAAQASYARQIRYEMELLKRIKAGEQVPLQPDFYSAATSWGEKYEPEARAEYEWRHDVSVIVPSFCVHPEYDFVGCSADGLVAIDPISRIGLEIKCPFSQQVHANARAHGIPPEHMPQVQGEAWVLGCMAIDFVSYDPRCKGEDQWFEQRIPRNDEYIYRLEKLVTDFWDFVLSGADYPKGAAPSSIPVLF